MLAYARNIPIAMFIPKASLPKVMTFASDASISIEKAFFFHQKHLFLHQTYTFFVREEYFCTTNH